MATIQKSLKFLSFNVSNVVFERPFEFISGELQINIEHLPQINPENKNLFKAIFIVLVSDKEKKFNLQVKAFADFEIIGVEETDIYNSFVNVNAPAIAYPYLRAFISNMVLQSGMAPIIIPPVNFTKQKKNKEDSNITEKES